MLMIYSVIGFSQTNVSVFYADDSYETFLISESGRLYFSNDNLLVDTGDLNPTTITMSDIRKLTFTAINTTDAKSLTSDTKLYVYPTLANNEISINGLTQESVMVTLYSSCGIKIREFMYEQGSHIDVSALPMGLYFVKINKSVLKFSKL